MVWNDTEKDVNLLITRARVSAKVFIIDLNGKFPKQHNSSHETRQSDSDGKEVMSAGDNTGRGRHEIRPHRVSWEIGKVTTEWLADKFSREKENSHGLLSSSDWQMRCACVGGSDISVEDNWLASANWIGDPYTTPSFKNVSSRHRKGGRGRVRTERGKYTKTVLRNEASLCCRNGKGK